MKGKRSYLSMRTGKRKGTYPGLRDLRLYLLAAVFIILMWGQVYCAFAQAKNDKWHFAITPYLWAPSIDGTLRYDQQEGSSGSPNADLSTKNILEALDFGFMFSGDVRKGKWLAFTDIIYLDFSAEKSTIKSINFTGPGLTVRPPIEVNVNQNVDTNGSLKATAWNLAGGYGLIQQKIIKLDIFCGFRYLGVDAKTDWALTEDIKGPLGGLVFNRSGTISQREDLWDGIMGIRGRAQFGKSNWFIPYYFDIGAGSSEMTWQGLLGLAYGFKWGDIVFDYRHLYYNMNDGGLLEDVRFSGPGLSASFRF